LKRLLSLSVALIFCAVSAVTAFGAVAQPTNTVEPINATLISVKDNIRNGTNVEMEIRFEADFTNASSLTKDSDYTFSLRGSQWDTSNANLEIKSIEVADDGSGFRTIEAKITKLRYIGVTINGDFKMTSFRAKDGGTLFVPKNEDGEEAPVTLTIDSKYFAGSSNSSNTDDTTDKAPTSQIVIENAYIADSAGKRIDEVTDKSPSFTLHVSFVDMGLIAQDVADTARVYITSAGGFDLPASNVITARRSGSDDDAPRFVFDLKNVKFNGGTNAISFSVYYQFEDYGWYYSGDDEPLISGTGTATFTAAGAKDASTEMAMAQPKIIISNYSYGGESIIAGTTFDISLTITNTSKELPLENIVMTLTPAANEASEKGPGLIVASSSNTIYEPMLEPEGSRSYTIAFQARPDAEVTSHLVNINFSYEYVDTVNEERFVVPTSGESVAIPVIQLDRFELDPIAQEPYTTVGDDAYLTVSFVNKGKSTLSNLSGKVEIDPSVTVPTQNYGHLEAGKPDSIEFYLTPTAAGMFPGEVIISYEDEEGNIKEVKESFNLTVDEPYMPPTPIDPEAGFEVPVQLPNTAKTVVTIIGGLLFAAPIAFYQMKKAKAKALEAEDDII
jgi:hypothetical protein